MSFFICFIFASLDMEVMSM